MTFFFAGEAATSQQFRESETPLILLSRSIMKNGSPERPDALAASNGIRNEVRSRSFPEANYSFSCPTPQTAGIRTPR
jgi:hypothetical protein